MYFCTRKQRGLYLRNMYNILKKEKTWKSFLFSMALALGAICMPSQANAAEMASPVVNPVKTAAPVSLASTEDDDVVIIIIIIEQPDDGGGLTTL